MDCIHCGKTATHLDLCHGRNPVCDQHLDVGHQLEAIQPAPKPGKRNP